MGKRIAIRDALYQRCSEWHQHRYLAEFGKRLTHGGSLTACKLKEKNT
jgi:hypothetical protein